MGSYSERGNFSVFLISTGCSEVSVANGERKRDRERDVKIFVRYGCDGTPRP